MVLGFIDPTHQVSHLLSRSNCVRRNNVFYLKDLRLVNRELKDCVAVDNSIIPFLGHIDNLAPIVSFKGEQEDCELLKIEEFLVSSSSCADHRVAITHKYMLSKFIERCFGN